MVGMGLPHSGVSSGAGRQGKGFFAWGRSARPRLEQDVELSVVQLTDAKLAARAGALGKLGQRRRFSVVDRRRLASTPALLRADVFGDP